MTGLPKREKGMIFLPEADAWTLEESVGFAASPLSVAEAMTRLSDGLGSAEEAPAPSPTDYLRRALRALEDQEHPRHRETTEHWRGMLAVCLLMDAWAEEAEVSAVRVEPRESAFASAVLSGVREPLWLAVLSLGDERRVLGVANRKVGLLPAAQAEDLSPLLPERVGWYDARARRFSDPSRWLNESDRALLLRRLTLMKDGASPAVERFRTDLTKEGLRPAQEAARQEEDALRAMAIRAKAVMGLAGESCFDQLTVRMDQRRKAARPQPLLECLGLSEEESAAEDSHDQTWLWKGIPFARTSAVLGLEETGHPREAEALVEIDRELEMLERCSPAWNRDLARKLDDFLMERRASPAFSPAARTVMEAVIHQAHADALEERETLLTWPWDAEHGAARFLVREGLGDALADGMRSPFADKLCLLPGGAWNALDDATLSRVCFLPAAEDAPACAVIPPLSAELAACLEELRDEGYLLLDSFAFRRVEGGVEAAFTLSGHRRVTVSRVYAPEETRLIPMEAVPTVAVWPFVSLRESEWRAYYVYQRGGALRVEIPLEGQWLTTEDRLFSVIRTTRFPSMLVLRDGQNCLGALPNVLPKHQPGRTEPVVAAIDLGASGCAAALRQGNRSEPLSLPNLVRTVLHGMKAASLEEDFLPARPIGPVTPAIVELFDQAPDPEPLTQGHILMAESARTLARQEGGDLHCALKWGAEESDVRARRLMLRQVMMLCSLAAVRSGAPSVAWRIILPEGVALEGRKRLWREMNELAPMVARETGLPLTPGKPAVAHGDERMALEMYLRGDSGLRGSFLAVDIGAESAAMTLWLRGMNRPAVRCLLPLGVHAMLLNSLLLAPECLREDFDDLPDAPARQCVMDLADRLPRARTNRREMEKCGMMLDLCLSEHLGVITSHMAARYAQGSVTTTHALLLCGFGLLLALAGLVQERAWRDPLMNDYLPAEMTLCLAGRGSQVLTAQPEMIKARLARMIRLMMSADHPVRFTHWSPSALPKCEMAMGLARAANASAETPAPADTLRSAAPMTLDVGQLAGRFVTAFHAEFAGACERLFPNMIAPHGGLTAEGSTMVAAAAARQAEALGIEAALAGCVMDLRAIE